VPRALGNSDGATILPILGDRGHRGLGKARGHSAVSQNRRLGARGTKTNRIYLICPSSLTFPGFSRKAYLIKLSPKPIFRCRAQRVRRFPRDHIAETVANVPTDFDERNRAALHSEILQRLHAPLLAFGELLFGEEDIDRVIRGIWSR
jgi:hypothetical protein